MASYILVLPILIPVIASVLVFAVSDKLRGLKEAIALLATFATMVIAFFLFGKEASLVLSWFG